MLGVQCFSSTVMCAERLARCCGRPSRGSCTISAAPLTRAIIVPLGYRGFSRLWPPRLCHNNSFISSLSSFIVALQQEILKFWILLMELGCTVLHCEKKAAKKGSIANVPLYSVVYLSTSKGSISSGSANCRKAI